MASSDSDSSLGDQTEYTETSVLLGYASKEVTEDAISHLGGVPVSTSPSRNHLTNLC
jgi:pre-rRNA-processing protein TSR4